MNNNHKNKRHGHKHKRRDPATAGSEEKGSTLNRNMQNSHQETWPNSTFIFDGAYSIKIFEYL